jgi:hypothetical protein
MSAGGRRALVWLGQAVTRADDAALGRVVALLDGLKDRGEADELLARARHRLHALRPPRPLAFTRLLFVPLDGVIVPASKWRRGEGHLPRSALPALADAVHRALGAEGEAIAAACQGRIMADADAVERVGRRLWPAAARVLPASAPPEWEAAGLVAADYAEIAALCRPLWAAGPALQAALAATGEAAPRERISAALHALAEAGPGPFAAGLATLMESTPLPGQVAQLAAGIDPRFRSIAVRQAEAALDRKGPEFDLLEPPAAGAAALALAIRYDDLEASGLLDLAARRRLHALRRGAEEACRDGFLASVERHVLAPLAALVEAPEVADETVAAIEAEARALARLECAGRRLGEGSGGGAYDRARRAIAEALRLLAGRALSPAGLRPMDLARIAEILCGTEEAAALLAWCGRAAAIATDAQPVSTAGTPAGSALPAR